MYLYTTQQLFYKIINVFPPLKATNEKKIVNYNKQNFMKKLRWRQQMRTTKIKVVDREKEMLAKEMYERRPLDHHE